MTLQEWLRRVKTTLETTYDMIEKDVLSVDIDKDEECRDHWMFSKLCSLKSEIDNTLAGLEEMIADLEEENEK